MFHVFLDNFILFDFWVFFCRRDKGSFIYETHREGEEGGWGRSQYFCQFCDYLRMVLGEGGLTLLNVHRCMKQIFFSVISEDILNFFPSRMFYWVLETCLICSPTMNRNNEQKNFIRFGSSSVCLFSYHQCFYTYATFEHYVPIVKVFLSHCRSFLSNWDSLYVRLNSHYKAWSYKKRKDKKIKAYSKSL